MEKYAHDVVVTVQFTMTPSLGSSAGIFVRMDLDTNNKGSVAGDARGYVGRIGVPNKLFLVRLD